MIEIILIIFAVIAMTRIAVADDQNPLLWGVATGLLCLGSLVIPLPFARVLIALVLSFVMMIVYKSIAGE